MVGTLSASSKFSVCLKTEEIYGNIINTLNEPSCEKTGFLHMRKQRRRSASQTA